MSGCSKSYGTLAPSLANGVTAMEWLKLGQSIPGGVGGCTLPSGGVFNLQVTTDQAYTSNNFKSFGSNTFAILAEPGSAPPDGSPCSTISDTTCPSVYGQDAMSLLVADSGASASACGDGSANCAEFYLAQIPPAAAGQPLTISLWDAGDTFATSGANIQIIQPNGQIVDVFKYWADGLHPSTKPGANNQDSCSGRGCVNVSAVTPPYTAGQQFGRRGVGKFSDSMLFIEIPIPGSYATDASQASGWFKIRYHFPAGVTIADRTTWHVSVNANPVHLVR